MSTASSNITPISDNKITWQNYFKYRITKGRVRLIAGFPGFVAGMGLALTQISFSPFNLIMGIDPSFVYGLGSVIAGAAGYQLGGAAGSGLWRLFNRSSLSKLDMMDKIFYKRINYYRAERGMSPYVNTLSSTGTMLKTALKQPNLISQKSNEHALLRDFYGEKIKSVQNYRQWLRKQRAFDRDLGNQKLINRHLLWNNDSSSSSTITTLAK